MSMLRTLALLCCAIFSATACLAPDDAPDGTEGQVVRELRAPLDRAWRETVAAIHETGVAVPRAQRPDNGVAKIRTDVVRVDLRWIDAEKTEATVLYYDRDALSARVRAESLLETIEDRLDRYGADR